MEIIDEIIKTLTDRSALNKSIALFHRGLTSGDREIYSDDNYRAENMLAAVEVIKHYKGDVDYFDLLQNPGIMKPLLDMAEKHISGGTRIDFLIGVTKTYNICYEHMLLESSIPRTEALNFIINYRKVFDAFELLSMRKWFMQITEKYHEEINNLSSDFRFAESQFRAILETFDYPAAVVCSTGKISMMNQPAYKYFALIDSLEKQICNLLDYHYINFCDFVKSYGRDTDKYVRFMNGEQFLTRLMKLTPESYIFSMQPVQERDMVKSLKEKLAGLTPSETVVCSYIIRGLSTKEISDELFISTDTVNTHRKNIRRKLGLSGRNESIADKLCEIRDIKF